MQETHHVIFFGASRVNKVQATLLLWKKSFFLLKLFSLAPLSNKLYKLYKFYKLPGRLLEKLR